jgi:hypothetical protein
LRKFKTTAAIERTQWFIEKLARQGWEPLHKDEPGFSKSTPSRVQYFDYNGKPVTELWNVIAKSSEAFRAALESGKQLLPPENEHVCPPHGFDIGATNSAWAQFEYERIFDIIKSNCVTSVSDATVKTTAYLQKIAPIFGDGNNRYLFRGQSNINHELIPRLGRVISKEIESGIFIPPHDPPIQVMQRELDELAEFKNAWGKIEKDEIDSFTVSKYANNDIGWWILMQHYADSFGNGTRLLDVTTSLLFALLFACVKWETGEIDDKNDGIIYFFVEGQNCMVNDYSEIKPLPSSIDFFNIKHDIKCMILNPPHNERSKAQGGSFIWWSKFWEPIKGELPYLRIPKENKLNIAKELLAFGVGPKESVRGEKGLRNEKSLREVIKKAARK